MSTSDNRNSWIERRQSDIGLSDVLKVMYRLEARSPETFTVIARVLGFTWEDLAKVPLDQKTTTRVNQASSLVKRGAISTQINESSEGIPFLVPESQILGDFQDWISSWVDFDDSVAALPPTESRHLQPLAHQPLLQPMLFRGIITELIATHQPSCEIDWPLVERRLLADRPIDKLPLRSRPTMKAGVQLLIDHSEAMQPFWREAGALATRLRRLIGEEGVIVNRFELQPLAPIGQQWRWKTKGGGVLRRGVPILIISNFGQTVDNDLGPDVWGAVLQGAAALQCPVRALVPLAAEHWPVWLKQLVPNAVEWDRSTTLQIARRASRRS